MNHWDYITLGTLKSYGINYRVNGEKQAQWKDLELHTVLHELGKIGWELVLYDGDSYIFKRPRRSTSSLKAKTGQLEQPSE